MEYNGNLSTEVQSDENTPATLYSTKTYFEQNGSIPPIHVDRNMQHLLKGYKDLSLV